MPGTLPTGSSRIGQSHMKSATSARIAVGALSQRAILAQQYRRSCRPRNDLGTHQRRQLRLAVRGDPSVVHQTVRVALRLVHVGASSNAGGRMLPRTGRRTAARVPRPRPRRGCPRAAACVPSPSQPGARQLAHVDRDRRSTAPSGTAWLSHPSGPLMICSSSARSRALRASGPMVWIQH